jgi:RNA polymerase sigma-70 factor, ECF subfamily
MMIVPVDDPGCLVDRLKADDETALRALFDVLHEPLVRFAGTIVLERAVADDLVQEAFVRLWDRRLQLEAATPPRAWLYRTVRNLALNHRRDAATRQRLLDDPLAADSAAVPRGAPQPDAALDERELSTHVTQLLEELPPRQREALMLSRVHGLSHVEVATAMGCAPRTVNNHLVAALATLRRRLTELGTMVASFAWWFA